MPKHVRRSSSRRIRRLTDLRPDPRNANRGTARGREALERSLREYGPGRAVLIDRHGHIIAGNKTVEEAKALGMPLRVFKVDGKSLIAVQRNDLDLRTDPRAKALAIADNRVGELNLDWNAEVFKQLQAEGLDLSPYWTADELAALFGDSTNGRTEENAVVEPGPTDLVRGDLMGLGHHRLLCGDATSPADVVRVFDGITPIVMVTDPPYGVHYEPLWRHRVHSAQRTAVGTVTNDHRADWTAALRLFPGNVAYVWHAALKAGTVAAALDAAGFVIRSQIIWSKQHFALSRGDYHWAHEPAWYAVRKGTTSQWQGDRTQTTVWDVANLNPMGGNRTGENAVTGHSTQKPVRLYEIPIRNHTTAREAIFDPFCGSGTAIIAAEKTGRRCLAIEIDPRYVHAAVTRWEAFTGQRAERLPPPRSGSGRTR